jgi:hypothetical protein
VLEDDCACAGSIVLVPSAGVVVERAGVLSSTDATFVGVASTVTVTVGGAAADCMSTMETLVSVTKTVCGAAWDDTSAVTVTVAGVAGAVTVSVTVAAALPADAPGVVPAGGGGAAGPPLAAAAAADVELAPPPLIGTTEYVALRASAAIQLSARGMHEADLVVPKIRRAAERMGEVRILDGWQCAKGASKRASETDRENSSGKQTSAGIFDGGTKREERGRAA